MKTNIKNYLRPFALRGGEWVVGSLFLLLTLASCEKPYVGEAGQEPAAPAANLYVNVMGFQQIPFEQAGDTRATTPVKDVCSRLNFVIYDGETKIKSIPQKKDDSDFGQIAVTIPQGTYKIAIIGHSSTASATVSSLDKISFDKNLVTDTFLYFSDIVIDGDAQTLNVELSRVVSMFRLQLTNDLPQEITQLKFYYTGGSSTLSALTGYGSVNSKQTVVLDVAPGQRQFDVYTFPHTEEDELKITISALDATQTLLKERTFEAVPVQRNRITRYVGDIFDAATPEIVATTVSTQVNAEWDGEQEILF